MEIQKDNLPGMKELKKKLDPFSKASPRLAMRQLAVTLFLYILMWVAMVFSLQIGYWLTLLLAIPAAGLLVRIFIFFHDCGHNSFLPSMHWNRRIGFWLGVLVFTPAAQWWRSHSIHHATSGNLDKRGTGDVMTLTVDEYQNLSVWGKLGYRVFRNPLIMFLLGPIWMFIIQNRWPVKRQGKRETMSVVWANLAIVAIATAISLVIGFKNYVLIQLPIIWLAGMAGIWMFYVQHQFEGVYWARDGQWNYVASAFKGASYYELPKVLQWFTGNIGFHHIHHLSPRVPNYYLEDAYQSDELLRQSPRLTIRESLACIRLTLIDEKSGKLVGF
jgi:omega-6 fatty acid desaturase (delta-12 desaturase)